MEDWLPKYEPYNLKTFDSKAKTEHEYQPISKLFISMWPEKTNLYLQIIYRSVKKWVWHVFYSTLKDNEYNPRIMNFIPE